MGDRMKLTPERIAEIHADTISGSHPAWVIKDREEAAELCRLARLGLRVEGAPTALVKTTPVAWKGPTWLAYEPLPNEWGGKRVALVVLEDSK